MHHYSLCINRCEDTPLLPTRTNRDNPALDQARRVHDRLKKLLAICESFWLTALFEEMERARCWSTWVNHWLANWALRLFYGALWMGFVHLLPRSAPVISPDITS
ncbi:hypothetical protein BJY04DRAFT_198863 [Aspergillus karnatakaensis]|uniref:uncharacterized protein n=1 Tax=Aspergillus karnatakaensis TaxID=1810916 RepID=UPI003CCD674F